MTPFFRHSVLAATVLVTLLLSGSQNAPSYWTQWQQARDKWYQAYAQQCQEPLPLSAGPRPATACRQEWRSLLLATMDYNREVNEFPGRWWRQWLHPALPECARIDDSKIPQGHLFSMVTATRLCDAKLSHSH